MKSFSIIFTLVISCTLFGCGEEPFFENNQAITGGSWQVADQPEFEVDIYDTITPYHFFMNIRHSGDYEYSNIYVFVHTIFPNEKTSKDTIELVLQHPDGRWKGTGAGDMYENRYMYKFAKRFPLIGHYKFRVEHAMRDETLNGVDDIGIRLEEANP